MGHIVNLNNRPKIFVTCICRKITSYYYILMDNVKYVLKTYKTEHTYHTQNAISIDKCLKSNSTLLWNKLPTALSKESNIKVFKKH